VDQTTMAAVTASPEVEESLVSVENNEEDALEEEKHDSSFDADDKIGSQKPAAKVSKKKKWKKPKDKPKRPLSAYNIFFRQERGNLLYGDPLDRRKRVKIGFSALAKNIAAKWKQLEPEYRRIYEVQAEMEQLRYKAEVDEWKRNQEGGSIVSLITPRKLNTEDVDGQARTSVFVSSNGKGSPPEMASQQQSRNALVNQLILAQLMTTYNGSNSMVNGNVPQMNTMNFIGHQYSNQLMANAEFQPQLTGLSAAAGGSGSVNQLDSSWVYSNAASAPRRMSMPTSTDQFMQMQQHHQQLQAEQMAMAAFPGGRRFSMPVGIIDSTHNTPLLNSQYQQLMNAEQQHLQQQLNQLNQHQLDIQQQQQDIQQQHQHFQQQPQENLDQQHDGEPSFDSHYVHEHAASLDILDDMHVTSGVGGRRSSMPVSSAALTSGRRLSMPLSVEQQMLVRNSVGLTVNGPHQGRSMSMPLGCTMPTDPQRGVDSLDELADILRDDGDIFDW
jgi:hypothetical protein